MLVASMNPCPCGYYGHPKKPCICTPHQRQQYLAKISGPLLDRIDLQIEVQPVAVDELASKEAGEPSAAIRARVVKARELQTQRFGATAGVHCNAQMTPSMIHQWAEPDAEGLRQLKHAIESMNMSARAYDRILKVARTIADLDGSPQVRFTLWTKTRKILSYTALPMVTLLLHYWQKMAKSDSTSSRWQNFLPPLSKPSAIM